MVHQLAKLPFVAAILLISSLGVARPQVGITIDFVEARHFDTLLRGSAKGDPKIAEVLANELSASLPIFDFTTGSGAPWSIRFSFCEKGAGWPYSDLIVKACSQDNPKDCQSGVVLRQSDERPRGTDWLGKASLQVVVNAEAELLGEIPFGAQIKSVTGHDVETNVSYSDLGLRPRYAVFRLVQGDDAVVFLACAHPHQRVGGPFLDDSPDSPPSNCQGGQAHVPPGRVWSQMFLERMWKR